MRVIRRNFKRIVATTLMLLVVFIGGLNLIDNNVGLLKTFQSKPSIETKIFSKRNLKSEDIKRVQDASVDALNQSNFLLSKSNHDSLNPIKTSQTVLKSEVTAEERSQKVEAATENKELQCTLSCKELQQLLKEALTTENSELRKENDYGNRGIYSSSYEKEDGEMIKIVLKLASLPEPENRIQAHLYRYRTALKEIKTLRELNRLQWKGVPKLYGYCVTPTEIVYAVSRVVGRPLCRGMGISMSCAIARDLAEHIETTPDPGLSTLTFLSKVTCFFEQFEKFHVFMEDISGTNLFYNEKTFDVYIVDADSLIFYGNTSLNSRTSCKSNEDCPVLQGNFWKPVSLNMKIYSLCREMKGLCVENICSGLDASLHTCGVAKWLVSSLRSTIPKSSRDVFKDLLHCMMLPDPRKRCSLKKACHKFTQELIAYQNKMPSTVKSTSANQTLDAELVETTQSMRSKG